MKKRQLLIGLLLIFGVVFTTGFFYGYQLLYTPNFNLDGEPKRFYIATGSNFNHVYDNLRKKGLLHEELSFAFLSKLMKYQENVKPGAYLIPSKATNVEVIRLLRSGKQEPISLTFNNFRKVDELLPYFAEKFEFEERELRDALLHPDTLDKLGFDSHTIPSFFIPNTYQFFWNTSAQSFIRRMKREYKTFWNEKRLAKAKAHNLSPTQVSIIASIVEAETQKRDEMPTIARVYKNRVDKGMRLQADPTVVFAIGDFSIRRVLNVHLQHDSPYNTYKYSGLPPGPIRIPAPSTIDAVLNMENHNYIYFCAKADMSGYHSFSVDYAGHIRNARAYQRALNELNIR